MQEKGKLVLGIDLCNDITQVSVMRPHAAEPDAVCFDARTSREFLHTLLWKDPDGEWGIGETMQQEVTVLPPFFHAAIRGECVVSEAVTYSGKELLERYVSLLFQKIDELFEGQKIGFVAVTCEEANRMESVKELLRSLFEKQVGEPGTCLVLSHLESFLHFVIRQEEGLWKNGSAVFDYTTEGLLFYHMECRMAAGRRLLLADYKDYSEIIPPGFITQGNTEQGAFSFERLATMALQQKVASLFVTGRGFEGEWVSDVLRLLSGGRRVFRGQNLYTQGACYAGAEEFRNECNVDFALLTPGQITVDVLLVAENAAQEDGVYLARVGDRYRQVNARAEVLLDGTDKLTFRILPAGAATPTQIRVAPQTSELRGDRTNRYEVRVFFVGRNLMVIQLKETGFGAFYESGHRIYEEIVDFSNWEL
ncbi:MAG: hypothetical protein IKB07_08495 [Lachnospiraceae bacterium]|nr:hypothetical protein [Lachnospiraceae bacterium]